jgi:hypothetical protein
VKQTEHYAGWAMVALPRNDKETMKKMVAAQKEAGANFLWIGHNNPGVVEADKWEPALSYSVYEAYTDKSDPRHDEAVQMVRTQERILEVTAELGLPVVFPVGYQIQMGKRWTRENPDELRRHKNGDVVDYGGISATFLSPRYQDDIRRYYNWIQKEWIARFEHIMMINMADEPFGGDYSAHAEKDFHAKTGLLFADVDDDPESFLALGNYQANYINEYARWSAMVWQEINPDMPTTMSFCGFHGREENLAPDITGLFRDMPDTFQPTWDCYPRDGSYKDPIGTTDITSLNHFLTQIGLLSNIHNRKIWMWSTGNSWGLGQNSNRKGNISDAVANQYQLALAARQGGGNIGGLAVWNYNIPTQGLYNDRNPIIYEPDEMFKAVSGTFADLREIMKAKKNAPKTLLYISREEDRERIGEEKLLLCPKSTEFAENGCLLAGGVDYAMTTSLEVLEPDKVELIIGMNQDCLMSDEDNDWLDAWLNEFESEAEEITVPGQEAKALLKEKGLMSHPCEYDDVLCIQNDDYGIIYNFSVPREDRVVKPKTGQNYTHLTHAGQIKSSGQTTGDAITLAPCELLIFKNK